MQAKSDSHSALPAAAGLGRPPMRGRRGVAIVIVIMILAAMLAVIAPFVLSMTQTTKVSSSYLEASRAQALAEGGNRAAHAWLNQADPMLQQQASGPPFNRPNLTTLDMLQPPVIEFDAAQKRIHDRLRTLQTTAGEVRPLPPEKGDPFQGLQNARGDFLDVKITDEQSKLNINTVPCRVLGSLLASCLTTQPVDSTSLTFSVDDASQFYDDGNPQTVDGYIAINGVRRPYLSASGGIVTLQTGFDTNMKFPINSLVYDGRAEMIREMRNQQEFQSIYELREIGTKFGPTAVIRPQEFERILPFLTAHSFRPSKWTAGTRILDRGFSSDSYGVQVEDPRGFDAQAHVAIFDSTAQGETQIGRREGYIVTHSNPRFLPQQPQRYRVGFVQSLGFDLNIADNNHNLWLRSEIPHPVNINTASWDVLKAMVKGIPSQGGIQSGAVGEATACAFANAVTTYRKTTPIDSYDALYTMIDGFVQQGAIDNDFAVTIQQSLVADRQGMQCAALPVCFRSYFDYTVESHARVFDAASNLRSQAGVIETFRIPARYPGMWYVDSQSQWRLQADLNGAGSGYLIGPRYVPYNGLNMAFYANVHPLFSDLQPDYDQVQERNGEIFTEVEFGMAKAQDLAYMNFEGALAGVDMMMGRALNGRIELGMGKNVNQLPAPPVLMAGWFFITTNWGEIFYSGDPDLNVPRDSIRLTQDGTGLAVHVLDSTGEEYITKFPQVKLLRNTWYHLMVTATGAQPGQVFLTIDGKPATGMKLPDQILRLAADIPDQFDPIGTDPMLNNANITLDGDAGYLPDLGTIRIGDEIIEYNGKSGNTLQRCLRGRRFTTAVPHAAGEFVTRVGFSVKLQQPFIGKLNGRLVGMKVKGADVGLPAARPECSINMPNPPNPNAEIDSGDVSIPIFKETVDKMPDYGFAVIDYQERTIAGVVEKRPAELIWYSARDDKTLLNVQRGMHGSTAGKHWHNCRIYNVFVEATSLNGYMPPAGQKFIVQVDNKVNPETEVEWIEYSTIYTQDGHSYLAHPPNGAAFGNNKNAMQGWNHGIWERGVYDTGMAAHNGNEKLILVRSVDKPWLGQAPYTWDPTWSQNPLLTPKKPTTVPGMYTDDKGTGNEVYLTEANNRDALEQRYVKRAWYNHPWKDHKWNGALNAWERTYNGRYGGPYLVGLNDNPQYDYPVASSRIVRTPVPEFINSQFLYKSMQVNRASELGGFVDELRYGSTYEMIDGTVYTDDTWRSLGSSETTIMVQDATANQLPKTGLAMIGDEVVYFENANAGNAPVQILNPFPTLATPNAPPADLQAKMDNLPQWNGSFTPRQVTLSSVQRGLFGTTAQDWPAGTRVRLITPFFASSSTSTGATADISLIDAAMLPNRGFVASYDQSGQINEVVGYLAHNRSMLVKSGTLRNRYGSGVIGGGGNLVWIHQPVRHLDYFMPSLSQAGGAFFPLQHRMEGGLWEGIDIDMVDYQPGVRAREIEPVVLVRFDGAPGWDAVPTNRPGGLYRLALTPGGSSKVAFPDAPIRADQIEVRLMQNYTSGAITSNDWKLALLFGRIRFLVHSDGQTHRRDNTE